MKKRYHNAPLSLDRSRHSSRWERPPGAWGPIRMVIILGALAVLGTLWAVVL